MSALVLMMMAVTASKTATLVSDPFNGIVTPKAIPGALIDYKITVTNSTLAQLDQDKTMVIDGMPANTKLCLGDLGLPGSGPVAFGSVLSGLSYSYGGLGAGGDDLEFSSSAGPTYTYTYTPTSDADGCDAAVTKIRINPKGKLNAGAAVTFRFRVMVK